MATLTAKNIESSFAKELLVFQQLLRRPVSSTEAVHQLRISSRRLLCMLLLVKCPSSRELKDARRGLRMLMQILGNSRELDVALKDAKKYSIKFNRLKHKRKKSHRLLERYVLKHRDYISSNLLYAQDWVMRHPSTPIHKPIEKLSKKCQKSCILLAHAAKDLHDNRVLFKKVRYTLEALKQPTGPLPEILDCLGRAHDIRVLTQLAHDSRKARNAYKKAKRKSEKIMRSSLKFAVHSLEHLKEKTRQ